MTETVMRSFTSIVLMLGVVLVSLVARAGASQNPPAPTPAPSATEVLSPEDQAAKATFEFVCSACHETERATTTLRTPVEWTELIDAMASFGASGTESQFMQIQGYLNRRYGKVNVNRGTLEELQMVLSVSPAVAQAILDYRSTTRITSADDLKNVAGFPVTRLDALKPHLQF